MQRSSISDLWCPCALEWWPGWSAFVCGESWRALRFFEAISKLCKFQISVQIILTWTTLYNIGENYSATVIEFVVDMNANLNRYLGLKREHSQRCWRLRVCHELVINDFHRKIWRAKNISGTRVNGILDSMNSKIMTEVYH